MSNMKSSEIFSIFTKIFDDYALKGIAAIGYVDWDPIGVPVTNFWYTLWKERHINKNQFAEMVQQLRNDPLYREGIHLYGGPKYNYSKRGRNWIECDGKRWILMEVQTKRHIAVMRRHGGGCD